MLTQFELKLTTTGRGMVDITDKVFALVSEAHIRTGLCHIFLHHTSASLVVCENADPLVQEDMETFMHRLVPDGEPSFKHTAEGPDDMPSHVRSILTQTFLTLPITNAELGLGRWQGLYLWEHRTRPHDRRMTVTVFA